MSTVGCERSLPGLDWEARLSTETGGKYNDAIKSRSFQFRCPRKSPTKSLFPLPFFKSVPRHISRAPSSSGGGSEDSICANCSVGDSGERDDIVGFEEDDHCCCGDAVCDLRIPRAVRVGLSPPVGVRFSSKDFNEIPCPGKNGGTTPPSGEDANTSLNTTPLELITASSMSR